jgi:hypothetical protein
MKALVTTDQPLIDGGVASVNWFNGRLVTGEDLTREQQATEISRLRLGRVVGSGVVYGLQVSAAVSASKVRPVIRVEPGLTVNRQGQVLELGAATEVALTRDRTGGSATDLIFRDCAPFQPGSYSAAAGVYLVTIAPATAGVGRAQVSGLGNTDAGCSVAFSISGVQFHLLQLALPPDVIASADLLRNRLAHAMAGTADPARVRDAVDPLSSRHRSDGLINQLMAARCLGPEQVPLAALHWTAGQGIRFIDLWAARRRITPPDPYDRFPGYVANTIRADAEALFCQFQDQVAEALASGAIQPSSRASDRFSYLPPVGIVPITSSASATGFDPAQFLGAQGSDELATIDAAVVRELVQDSFEHSPIVVGGSERIQRYVIWENELTRRDASAQRVMLFARETLTYRGRARVGVARFSRSRFSPTVI